MLEVGLAVDVAAFVDGVVVVGYYSSAAVDFGVFDPVHVASVDHLAAA